MGEVFIMHKILTFIGALILSFAICFAGQFTAQKVCNSVFAAGPQKVCPVMGTAIDKKIYVDYKGKRVYFCCSMCPAEFNKNPEKYIKKMEKDGVVLEKVPEPKK